MNISILLNALIFKKSKESPHMNYYGVILSLLKLLAKSVKIKEVPNGPFIL